MLIGQCGFEKSGNYLSYRILREILVQLGYWDSYSAKTQCWESLFRINKIGLSFPELKDCDEVFIQEGIVYLHNSHFETSFAIWDLKEFYQTSELIWTHQSPIHEHHTSMGENRYWFYIVRDGRDVVNSWMHYAVTPRMLQRHTHYTISKVEELYKMYDYFEKTTLAWVNHINAYLIFRDHYFEVMFEDLINNKAETVNLIVSHLGIDGINVNRIVEDTSVERTKSHAPQHFRRGIKGDWRTYFDDKHMDIFYRIAGGVMKKLGYFRE